jgi:hypothetical protein
MLIALQMSASVQSGHCEITILKKTDGTGFVGRPGGTVCACSTVRPRADHEAVVAVFCHLPPQIRVIAGETPLLSYFLHG